MAKGIPAKKLNIYASTNQSGKPTVVLVMQDQAENDHFISIDPEAFFKELSQLKKEIKRGNP